MLLLKHELELAVAVADYMPLIMNLTDMVKQTFDPSPRTSLRRKLLSPAPMSLATRQIFLSRPKPFVAMRGARPSGRQTRRPVTVAFGTPDNINSAEQFLSRIRSQLGTCNPSRSFDEMKKHVQDAQPKGSNEAYLLPVPGPFDISQQSIQKQRSFMSDKLQKIAIEAVSINHPTINIYDSRSLVDPNHPLYIDPKRTANATEMEAYAMMVRDSPSPFELAKQEVQMVETSMNSLLSSDHPVLNMAAKHFLDNSSLGKKVRATIMVLMAYATNMNQNNFIDIASPNISSAQQRLAEIVEIIHTASLFHDDVIDAADMRRNTKAVNVEFGNKIAILAGDFLLARASIALARLRSVEVMEVMSLIIEDLVKGEVMQSKPVKGDSPMEQYLRKNYYKTASIMANGCRSTAILGQQNEEIQDIVFQYGLHVGSAFQLYDDVLDFEQSSDVLGKPSLSDLRQGVITGPILFAQEEYPELVKLVERKFKKDGDIERAAYLVGKSNGMFSSVYEYTLKDVAVWVCTHMSICRSFTHTIVLFMGIGLVRAKALATSEVDLAIKSILKLRPSIYRDALIKVALSVVDRKNWYCPRIVAGLCATAQDYSTWSENIWSPSKLADA